MKPIASLIIAASLSAFAVAPVVADDVDHAQAMDLVEKGTIKDPRELNEAALELHPGAKIVDTELENEYGKYVYKLELRDSANVEWDVAIDAASGAVLENRQDDDD
ncbi:MAG: PepSY domain-containing protein [Porticoccaceae bacterium]